MENTILDNCADYIANLPKTYTRDFKPCSYFVNNKLSDIVMLVVSTKDVSITRTWHPTLLIETDKENHTRNKNITGFIFYDVMPKTKWLPIFLCSVFIYNFKENRRRAVSNKECLRVYAQAFWLILKNPRTWRIDFAITNM